MNLKLILTLSCFCLLFSSCSNDDDDDDFGSQFVGNWGQSYASLDDLKPPFEKTRLRINSNKTGFVIKERHLGNNIIDTIKVDTIVDIRSYSIGDVNQVRLVFSNESYLYYNIHRIRKDYLYFINNDFLYVFLRED